MKEGVKMSDFHTYRSRDDLLLMAQEVAALLSCVAYLSTLRGEDERIHVMSLSGLAQRLSTELVNSLDMATFGAAEGDDHA
ncbi:TPA: aminotransferase [Pluralibacter gergoviae]